MTPLPTSPVNTNIKENLQQSDYPDNIQLRPYDNNVSKTSTHSAKQSNDKPGKPAYGSHVSSGKLHGTFRPASLSVERRSASKSGTSKARKSSSEEIDVPVIKISLTNDTSQSGS